MSAYCAAQQYAKAHLGPAEREKPILLRVAATPKPLMRDAEVKDQAPAASLVLQVVPDRHAGTVERKS